MSAGGALFLAGTLDQVGGNPSSPLKHHLSTSCNARTANPRPVQVATFPFSYPWQISSSTVKEEWQTKQWPTAMKNVASTSSRSMGGQPGSVWRHHAHACLLPLPPPLLPPPFLPHPTRWLGAVNVCAARAQGLHAGAPALRTSHTTCPASARRAHVRARPCAPTPAHLPHPPLAAHFARSQAGAARWTRHRLNSGAWGPPPRPPGRGVTSAGFVAHPTALAVAAGDVPVCCQVVV